MWAKGEVRKSDISDFFLFLGIRHITYMCSSHLIIQFKIRIIIRNEIDIIYLDGLAGLINLINREDTEDKSFRNSGRTF